MEPAPTDYCAKFNLSQDQFQKLKEKYKKDKDFITPTTDAEKEYALDSILTQLTEVKNG